MTEDQKAADLTAAYKHVTSLNPEGGDMGEGYWYRGYQVREAFLAGVEHGRPKWIPVSERLPEDFRSVVVRYVVPGCEAERDVDYHDSTGCWNSHEPYVTHWMPLPQEPRV